MNSPILRFKLNTRKVLVIRIPISYTNLVILAT